MLYEFWNENNKDRCNYNERKRERERGELR